MKALFFAALLFLFAAQGFSQQKLTLGEAVQLAKKNNSEYVIAKLDLLKAEKKVSEVYSENLVPTLTLNSRYSRAFKKQTINIFGETFELGTDNSIITSLDVSESIPFLGTPVMNGIKIAKYYSRLQQESVTQIESKIKADVTKSFYNVLLLKEVVLLNKQSIVNSEENLRVVEARNRAGVALEFDVIRARVKVETLKPQLSLAENSLQIARKVFKNTVGLKDAADVDATGNLIYDSTEVWGPTDNLIKKISERNVSVRQLILTKKINEELVDVDYANYLPKLYLFGQYSLQANENDDKSISRYRFFNVITAGIGLTWTLMYSAATAKTSHYRSKENRRADCVKELLNRQKALAQIEDAKNQKSQKTW
jgi:outer membrane protein TolC